jgi:HlyD family secretion protein
MKRLWIVVLLLVLGACGYGTYAYGVSNPSSMVGHWVGRVNGRPAYSFRTTPVVRETVLASVSATGTIEPEEIVDVGAQVAGLILKFGPDPRDSTKTVDYGTPVDKDTVLAILDPSLYKARVDQAQANLQRAKAAQQQMEAKLFQARRDWDRARGLQPNVVISPADYDLAEATYKTADANVADAKAGVAQSEATLKEAQTNLGYTVITSPVKGVILDRRVNVGQTVVASLSAPSLFLIAKDLHRVQIWASVNEADIGMIKPRQKVKFTVDAYPNDSFEGVVADDQPRLNATMTQNVVTYTVVVTTENPDLKLKPYMTANLQFEVEKRADALVVPNSALRWKPQPAQVAPEFRDAFAASNKPRRPGEAKGGDGKGGDAKGGDTKGGDAKGGDAKGEERDRRNRGVVWVEDGGFVRPVKVKLGLSDGAVTEIAGQTDLTENTPVVIGENHQGAAGDNPSNPFTPQLFGPKKKE